MHFSPPIDKESKNDIFEILAEREKEEDKQKKESLGVKMEPRYFEEDYNKEYEPNDLKRIVKGTFNASKYFGKELFSAGPWRVTALEKAKKDSKFKKFFKNTPKRELDYAYLCNHKTKNEDFEKLAEKCRLEWNKEFSSKSSINSYEDAFRKAFSILSEMIAGMQKDPFNKRRVEVLYDEHNKLYLVNKTFDTRFFMRPCNNGIDSILFDEEGNVIFINGVFTQ